ncbi:hypothetical protein [Rhodopirellula sallentina]|uniref:Uncharacterized protein n=1 Tax=Rhodopirellula sallentina SM41 TaxID=1263870 RepID=M5U652_9BACT|nr:hypothetical protein [Rhodopirellula sallentina]EMI56947.1 hypothetical protein RSSM_01628 [Rhodopirellula sallentina SM41]
MQKQLPKRESYRSAELAAYQAEALQTSGKEFPGQSIWEGAIRLIESCTTFSRRTLNFLTRQILPARKEPFAALSNCHFFTSVYQSSSENLV